MRSLRIYSILLVAVACGLSGVAKETLCTTHGCRASVSAGCVGPGCVVAQPPNPEAPCPNPGCLVTKHTSGEAGCTIQPCKGETGQLSGTVNQGCGSPGCLVAPPQSGESACPTVPCKGETIQLSTPEAQNFQTGFVNPQISSLPDRKETAKESLTPPVAFRAAAKPHASS